MKARTCSGDVQNAPFFNGQVAHTQLDGAAVKNLAVDRFVAHGIHATGGDADRALGKQFAGIANDDGACRGICAAQSDHTRWSDERTGDVDLSGHQGQRSQCLGREKTAFGDQDAICREADIHAVDQPCLTLCGRQIDDIGDLINVRARWRVIGRGDGVEQRTLLELECRTIGANLDAFADLKATRCHEPD